jgi:hypothetical protein
MLGFAAGGSPATERKRGFDDTRAQNLSQIASCISSYGYDKKALPVSLDALKESTQYTYCGDLTDPETGVPYTYHITTASEKIGDVTQGKFELCANVALESTKETIARTGYTSANDKWSLHPAGNSCDTEVVTLDRIESKNFIALPPVAVPVK